jgi:predicted small secreted protein
MYSLGEREKMGDRLWGMLIEQTNDEDAMEIIKAIELNYRHLERLKWSKRFLDQQNAWIEEERQKRVQLAERSRRMKVELQCRIIIAIMILTVIALLWACTGCQTMGGACRDIEAAARYGHEHLTVDE